MESFTRIFFSRAEAREVFRNDGSSTVSHTARRAVRTEEEIVRAAVAVIFAARVTVIGAAAGAILTMS